MCKLSISIWSTSVYDTKNVASESIFETGKIDQGTYGKAAATAANTEGYSGLLFEDLEKQAMW